MLVRCCTTRRASSIWCLAYDRGIVEIQLRAGRRELPRSLLAQLLGEASAEIDELGDMVKARRLARDGTEKGRRGFEAADAFEERGHAGQRDDELRNVARLVERLDGGAEQCQRSLGLAFGGVQARRVASDEALEELDAVRRTNSTPSSHANSARFASTLENAMPDDPQGVGDPVGVAELPSRGDRVVGEIERLVDATGRLQAVDVGRDPVGLRRPRERRHRAPVSSM